MSDFRKCTDSVGKFSGSDGLKAFYGAIGGACWSARSRNPTSPQYYPRVDIGFVVYRDESSAKQQMAHFSGTPPGLHGEAEKVFPLRSGFRAGNRIIVV